MTQNVLVTGGAGYIGSHTCKALAQAGYTPVTYDSLVYGHRWAVQWGPLEVGDVLDRARLAAVMRRYRPAAVIHFAAFAYVGESVTDPARYYHNNVAGTVSLLQAMRDAGAEALVFSSTCATYGIPDYVPMDEDHPQRPINPYGHSKQMVEQVLRDCDRAYGLRSLALRYFNAAGASPQAEIGEAHEPETHLIPLVLQAAAGRSEAVTVYGDDYDTPDGTCIRDYIHVSDLADAHVAALQALEAGAPTGGYNLGTGQGCSVRQIIDTAERVTGRRIPVRVGDRRPGDPPRLVADAARARRDLGWRHGYSDPAAIIEDAWRWMQQAAPQGAAAYTPSELTAR